LGFPIRLAKLQHEVKPCAILSAPADQTVCNSQRQAHRKSFSKIAQCRSQNRVFERAKMLPVFQVRSPWEAQGLVATKPRQGLTFTPKYVKKSAILSQEENLFSLGHAYLNTDRLNEAQAQLKPTGNALAYAVQ
jgi:hypothetical protein